jgi:hypothetical protein
MLWFHANFDQILVVWFSESNPFLKYLLNARFNGKNPTQADEKTGKTAHILSSGWRRPKNRQAV